MKNEGDQLLDTGTDPKVAIQPMKVEKPSAEFELPLSCNRIFEEIGEFGLYQILVGIATGVALYITGLATYNFVFTSVVPEHRCLIPQCEGNSLGNFEAAWTKYAVPYQNGRPDGCHRYQFIGTAANESIDGTCGQWNFNQSHVNQCDSLVIKNNEERLISRLGLLCTGQEDKFALIGAASTLGRLFGMPVSGILADKIGRLHAIIGCSVVGAIFGSLQALPASVMSYELYVILELCVAFTTAGVLGCCYVFNSEWVPARYRVYLNSIASIANSMHPAGIGLIAWYFEDSFYLYKLMLALPGFFMLIFYAAIRESPQWLLAKHKYAKTIDCITFAGKVNGRPPHKKIIDQIQAESLYNEFAQTTTAAQEPSNRTQSNQVTVSAVLKQKSLAFRLCIISLVWIFSEYAYFGIIMGSRNVYDNKYVSFVFIGTAEIPGTLLGTVLLNRIGRRRTIGANLLVCGLLLIISTHMTVQLHQLIMFFVGRAAMKAALLGLGTYTTELWPTATRNTLFSICALCGRFGGIFASLSVLLVKYYVYLPVILTGSATICASILLMAFLPETLHCARLPDTVDEALAIGKSVEAKSVHECADA